MKAAVPVPVTVKCRLGVDDQDIEEALDAVADAVVAAGVDGLVVSGCARFSRATRP
jgi:tRNA-dihydrouridine synthase A